jgi:hypothetical protein
MIRFRPWPPFQLSELGRIRSTAIIPNSAWVPIWCPLRYAKVCRQRRARVGASQLFGVRELPILPVTVVFGD